MDKDSHLKPQALEKEILSFWNSKNIDEELSEYIRGGKNHYLVRPPSSIRDQLTWKDIYKNIIYDVWARYWCLKNYNVRNGFGFDPSTLRIERMSIKSERSRCLSYLSKKELSELEEKIKSNSEELLDELNDKYRKIGLWKTGEFDYKVSDELFIDSCFWTLKKLVGEGVVAKKKRPIKWCPNCKAPITKSEMSLEREVKQSLLVKVPLSSGKDRYFLTEVKDLWKIPASTSLMVDTDEEYFILKYDKGEEEDVEQLVLIKDRAEELMEKYGIDDYSILKSVSGEKLEGLAYRDPLHDKLSGKKKVLNGGNRVIASKAVRDGGTGLDFLIPYENRHWEIIKDKKIKYYDPLLENGYFEGGPKNNEYSGLSFIQAESLIFDHLLNKGLVLEKKEIKTESKRCESCKSRIIDFPKREYFIDAENMDDSILQKIKTHSSGISLEDDIEFKDFLISRRSHWGIPFPAWECECGNRFFPENIEELIERSNMDDVESSSYSDFTNMKVYCPMCEKEMEWEKRSFTPTFLEGCSPWAQLGYPQEEKEYQTWWPGKLFYDYNLEKDDLSSLNMVISGIIFDETTIEYQFDLGPMIEEIEYGRVKDLVAKQGYDSMRVNLLANDPPSEPMYIEGKDFQHIEPLVKVSLNLLKFLKENLNKNEKTQEDLESYNLANLKSVEDLWILSKTERLKGEIKKDYEKGRFDKVIKNLKELIVEDFGQWYVKLARDRLQDEDVLPILSLTNHILKNFAIMTSPIAPYLAEKLYKELDGKEISVFIEDWPKSNEDYREDTLEKEMISVKEIVSKIISSKRESELPIKWPLKEVVYEAKTSKGEKLIERFERVIEEKAKLKNIRKLKEEEEWEEAILKVKPDREEIGKSYPSWESKIATMLENKSPESVKEGIENGDFTIGLQGQMIEIDEDMVTFEKEMPEGYAEIVLEDLNIYIDLSISEEIWLDEMVKEIKLRIKSMRKDLNLEEGDELIIYISCSDEIEERLNDQKDQIKKEVGGRKILVVVDEEEMEEAKYILEWEINDEIILIGVKPLYKTKVVEYYSNISGVDDETAEALYEAGYTSIDQLKKAEASQLSDIEEIKRSLARKIVNSLSDEEQDELEEKEDELEKIKEDASEKASEKGEYREEVSDEESDVESKEKDEEKKETVEKEDETSEEDIEEEHEKDEKEDIDDTELPEHISKSSTYLLMDKRSNSSFKLFRKIIESGERGFCVSRDYPDKVKDEYNLHDVEMIWLSNVDREDVIRPKSLEKLSLALENFLTKTGGVIMLNGLEYLITNNDFKTVLHLIQSIKDQVAINESILLIPVNPSAMNENHIDLISGEVDELIEN